MTDTHTHDAAAVDLRCAECGECHLCGPNVGREFRRLADALVALREENERLVAERDEWQSLALHQSFSRGTVYGSANTTNPEPSRTEGT